MLSLLVESPEISPRTAEPFEAIYREHFAFAWRTARRMSMNEANADDVVQDTFLVLHRRLSEYDGGSSMRGWIYGILVRVVADHRRRARRKDRPLTSLDADPRGADALVSRAPSPMTEAETREGWSILERLLHELPDELRETLVLSKLEGLSAPEIAECVGANVNTVYSRLRTATQRFETLYAEFVAEEERRSSS